MNAIKAITLEKAGRPFFAPNRTGTAGNSIVLARLGVHHACLHHVERLSDGGGRSTGQQTGREVSDQIVAKESVRVANQPLFVLIVQ